ncbi:MAG: hypothetical protein QM817_10160 [Archangium sp.]
MTDALRVEHDAVLSSLETRASTHHFAHAAVSFFLSVSLFGSAGKLWWDYWSDEPQYAIIAASLGGIALTYSATRALLGSKNYRAEKQQVARLLDLRKAIGADAPLALTAEKSA